MLRPRVAIVGPVFPFRAGIAYCTTMLARELSDACDVSILSFSRQYPRRFYPGSDDRDESLKEKTPQGARFGLDILNPLTWIREGLKLRRSAPDVVVFTWWIWVWAVPYRVIAALLPRRTRVIVQCHNATDKEPARWKSWLNRWMLRRGDAIVVHAAAEQQAVRLQLGEGARVVRSFLPVHELGGEIPDREEARCRLGVSGPAALFFGHVRPFKGLDIALEAWSLMESRATLLVAGEVWWNDEAMYRQQVRELGLDERVRLELRFIPDDEVALWFAAADVVVVPYRREAQSGVALTAFHFARPVIATEVGGVPEVVRDGIEGRIVPPGDPEALASALDAFFRDTPTAERMQKAAAAAAQKYSWSRYGSAFRAEIERLVEAG